MPRGAMGLGEGADRFFFGTADARGTFFSLSGNCSNNP
jgi:hypothetical protein